MQYFMIWTPTEASAARPPTPELMADLGAYFQEAASSIVLTGGLMPISQGARVVSEGGDVLVTDGPFAEAKEVVAGFAIIDAATKEQAVEQAERFTRIHAEHGWDGTTEVRPLMPAGPPA